VADPAASWDFFQQNRDSFELSSDDTREASDAENFDADENVFAGYAMTTLDFGRLRVTPGVRFEYTGDYASTTAVSGSNDYTHILPGSTLRYQLDGRTNLRGAVTRSLARPNYRDLVPYRLVNREDEEIELGNPELEVTTATNVDLLFERYFQSIGVLSGGVFYKQLSDYIYSSTYDLGSGTYAGFEAVQPVNGGDATLWGVELGLNRQLTFLPGALAGLGLYTNYTFTDSDAEIVGRGSGNRLPGQARHTANVAVSYDLGGFSTRLAWNYFGDFVDEVGEDAADDRIGAAHRQFDLAASYQINRGLQAFLEVINLTDECFCFYRGDESRPEQQEWYSRWGHVGFKLTDPLAWFRR